MGEDSKTEAAEKTEEEIGRLATVRSGPDRSLFCRPLKKTGPYGPVNWDRSPDRKILSGLGKNGPVSSSKCRPIKKTGPYGPALWDRSPVRSQRKLDWTVRSSLRPDRLVGFALLGDLEHVSVTPKRYS